MNSPLSPELEATSDERNMARKMLAAEGIPCNAPFLVLEIGAERFRLDRTLSFFDTLVDCRAPINPYARRRHHIDRSMLIGAPASAVYPMPDPLPVPDLQAATVLVVVGNDLANA